MTEAFRILNKSGKATGLDFSMPSIAAYQEQKRIKVVSAAPLNFGNQNLSCENEASIQFLRSRLDAALKPETPSPSYFPGQNIPDKGNSGKELNRGNLLIDQLKHLFSFDEKGRLRLRQGHALGYKLYKINTPDSEWHFPSIGKPHLNFLKQMQEGLQEDECEAEMLLSEFSRNLYAKYFVDLFKQERAIETLAALCAEIAGTWYQQAQERPVKIDEHCLKQALSYIETYRAQLTRENFAAFIIELEAFFFEKACLEAMNLTPFASGVFEGNFIQVSLMPLEQIKATEFCVRERLLDEVINLIARGFAPVVINEYSLVADGNHRVTSAWLWNLLKYLDEVKVEWSLQSEAMQEAVARFFSPGGRGASISEVSKHEVLSHFGAYLARPEWIARLRTQVRPHLASYEYLDELPVVLVSEYRSCAVVKLLYDEGIQTVRACPSLYERMAEADNLVLPPRASYHFTDSALLPWFNVLTVKPLAGNQEKQNENLKPRRIPNSARKLSQKTGTYQGGKP